MALEGESETAGTSHRSGWASAEPARGGDLSTEFAHSEARNRQQCSYAHHFAGSLVRRGCRRLRCEPSFIPVRIARRGRGTRRLPLAGCPRRRHRGRHRTGDDASPGPRCERHRCRSRTGDGLAVPSRPARRPPRDRGRRQPAAGLRLHRRPHLCPAWHWTDQRRSVPEALRVLRTGGALALWWNDSDSTVPWIAGQDARLRRLFGADDSPHDPTARFRGLPAELGFVHRHVPWTRSVPLDMHLANLASYSDFLVLGREATTTFMAKERDVLAEVFPNEIVEENYVVSLAVANC